MFGYDLVDKQGKTWSRISVINIKAISMKMEFLLTWYEGRRQALLLTVSALSLPKLKNLQFMLHNVTTNFPLQLLLLFES